MVLVAVAVTVTTPPGPVQAPGSAITKPSDPGTTSNWKLAGVTAPQLSVTCTLMVYVPTGPAFAMLIAPVAGFPVNVPVKPGGVAAVTLAMEPLSAGAAVGVTVAEPPGCSVVAAKAPIVGAVFGVTLTIKLAVAVLPVLSITCKTTVLGPSAAVQDAETVAVTVPLTFVIPVTVMPGGALTTVTTSVPGG